MTEEERKERKREYNKKYHEANKKKIKERKREWGKKYREENREKIKASDKKYRDKNKEKIKERDKKYREENIEKIKKYRAENKALLNIQDARRRAQHKKATPAWYKQERDKVRLIYVKAREFGFHVDHIVPLQSKKVCGLHTWVNLQLLAPEINRTKGNHYWPDMP